METNNCQALVLTKWATEEELKTVRGIIYCIVNTVNDKKYIGYTLDTFRDRYNQTRLIKYSNKYFRNEVNKYSLSSFKVIILLRGIDDKQSLLKWESYYEKLYNTRIPNGYNACPCGIELTRPPKKIYYFKNIITGEIKKTNNLSSFAKQNNCHREVLRRMLLGRDKKSGNWVLPETPIHEDLYGKEYFIRKISTWEIIRIKNLADYCRKNHLRYNCMKRVLDGNRNTYNDFCHAEAKRELILTAKLINPKGQIRHFYEVESRIFCKKYNCSRDFLLKFINGEIKEFMGWKSINPPALQSL